MKTNASSYNNISKGEANVPGSRYLQFDDDNKELSIRVSPKNGGYIPLSPNVRMLRLYIDKKSVRNSRR